MTSAVVLSVPGPTSSLGESPDEGTPLGPFGVTASQERSCHQQDVACILASALRLLPSPITKEKDVRLLFGFRDTTAGLCLASHRFPEGPGRDDH